MVVLLAAQLLFVAAPIAAQEPALRLTEAMSVNASGLVDAYDSTSDWIEIHNPTQAAIGLAGWGLSDTPGAPLAWSFPAGSSIPAGDHLVVFASGDASVGGELHANFSLAGDGDSITLARPDGVIVSTLTVPSLLPDHSYGVSSSGSLAIFSTPTPGAANQAGAEGILADVDAAPGRGFLAAPTAVTLSHPDPNVTIRYTTNGQAPTALTGTEYAAPVPIDSTTTLRVAAFRSGWVTARPVTHTYVFADQVADEPRMYAPWVSSAQQRNDVTEAVSALPTISLVSSQAIGQGNRVATSVEWIDPAGGAGFQVDAGVEEVGGSSVKYAKDTWRLAFDGEWGESKLEFPIFDGFPSDSAAPEPAEEFKRLTLRTGSHDSTFYDAQGRGFEHRQTYIKARWADETMLELGHVNTHGRWVNVFLNGQYWGQYHLREHMNDHFMAEYFGGDNSDYVGINRGAVASGAGDGWTALSAARSQWSSFRDHIDPEAYIDWMLLSEFSGNFWDLRSTSNWRGAGPASAASEPGFIWQSSDPDVTLTYPDRPTIFPGPLGSWSSLLAERDPEFVLLLNDRMQALLREDGELTTSAAVERWDRLADQIAQSIPAELARWAGNMFPGDSSRPLTFEQWQADVAYVRNTVLPARALYVLNRLAANVSPIQAPDISGAEVPSGSVVNVGNPNGAGDVFVTFDGSDPRLEGGAVAPNAAALSEFVADRDLTVTARVRSGNQWGPIIQRHLTVSIDPNAPQLDAIADLVAVENFGVRYQLDAIDPNGDDVTFTESGLPAGLVLDPATGVINGEPTVAGISDVVITASDGANAVSEHFSWRVEPHDGDSSVPLILNEYNAVKSSELLADNAHDAAFGRVAGNGGDWIELLVTKDGLDVRGWSVAVFDREDGPLEATDTFTFTDNAVLSDLSAGTIITIAESQPEDLSYAPEDGDWAINARSATGFESALVTDSAGNFDSNRHGFRVLLSDGVGALRSPFMGETDGLRTFTNVGGQEVYARCDLPSPLDDPINGDARDSSLSSFGTLNDCGDAAQLRAGFAGDADCSGDLSLRDAVLIAQALTGHASVAENCDNRAPNQATITSVDFDTDGDATTTDVQSLLRCLSDVELRC